jgi:hypothetical protein
LTTPIDADALHLTLDKLSDKFKKMIKTNVSTLLREFPKVRRAVMSGETVIVETREGNLRITADRSEETPLLGCLRGQIKVRGNIVEPTTSDNEWKPSL